MVRIKAVSEFWLNFDCTFIDISITLEDVSDYVNPIAMTENKDLPDFKQRVANHEWQ